MNEITICSLDITDLQTAQKVWNIQLAAYQQEAALIQCWDLPPLKETVDSLSRCEELFYGAFLNEELSGAISFKVAGPVIDIHRLMVHPYFFRRGIAQALINWLEQLPAAQTEIVVMTGTENTPAIRLYTKCGFKKVKKMTVAGGLSLTCLKKERGS